MFCKRITTLRFLVFRTMQAAADAQEIAGNLVLEIARRDVLVTVGEVAAVPVAVLQF
jgi:hypothetical protein